MSNKKEQQEKIDDIRREQAREELAKWALFLAMIGVLAGFYLFMNSRDSRPALRANLPSAGEESAVAEQVAEIVPEDPGNAAEIEAKAVEFKSDTLQVTLIPREKEEERLQKLAEEQEKAKENPQPVLVD